MNGLDLIPLGLVFLILVVSMVAFIEFGYWLGSRPGSKKNKAQLSQVRAIMGASLGLVAFMLAFSFSMAQSHFETRVQAYFLEISAIDSAYRGADLLDGSGPDLAKKILLEFADLRLRTSEAAHAGEFDQVVKKIKEAERMHDQLWSLAESSLNQSGESSMFAQSIMDMINVHDARLQATLFNRIPQVIWLTLFVMALLGMLVMGYQAGLVGSRSKVATWTLAVTFSVVMALVTDLDRPNMTLFQVNHDLMVELVGRMTEDSTLLPQ